MQNKIKLLIIYVLSVCFAVCVFTLAFLNKSVKAEENGEITISVLTNNNQNYLPKGVEGCTYPIYDYLANDENGNEISDVVISVYYDVNSDSKKGLVSDDVLVVIENGRFRTNNPGVYVIEYIATKGVYSKIEKVYVDVVAEEDYQSPSYVINESIVSQSNTGNKIYLPDGKLTSSDFFGQTEIQIQVVYDGEYDCDDVEVISFDSRIKYFTPLVSGDYTVQYILTNILGTQKAVIVSKTIVVADSGMPIITEPSLSGVFVVGEKSTLPYVEAIQYYNGKIIYVPVAVSFDGESVGEDMSITPTESGVFDLVYTATNVVGGEDAQYVCSVMVNDVDEEKPYVDRLMKLDGFVGFYRMENDEDLENEVYVLETDGSKETAQMSFKNKIATQFLHIGIGAEPVYNNYSYLNFEITDSVNSSESINVRIVKGSNGEASFYLNGFLVKDLENANFASTLNLLEFKYDYENKTLIDGGEELISDIKSYVDGSEFLGFSSGSVYLKLTMGGITEKSQIKLSILGSYVISGETRENTRPKVVYENDLAAVIAYTTDIYQTISIKKYAAFDLFDENVKVFLTIVAPNSQIAVYEMLMVGDYDFTVEQYGFYVIRYNFVDQAGRSRSVDGVIQVVDRVAPTVERLPSFNFSVKKGTTYKFPSIEFKDNVTEDLTVFVYLIYGNHQKVLAKDGSYKFDQVGTYTVKYVAVDAVGNRTTVSYDIQCN